MNHVVVSIVRYAAIISGLGFLFAWFGVYDTGRLPFPERFAHWATSIGVGVLSAIWVMPEIFERRFPGQHVLVKIAIAAAAVSIPVTLALVVINYYAFGDAVAATKWLTQFGYVLVVSLVLTAGFAFAEMFEKTIATSAASGSDPAAPAIIDRLPPKLRAADIYAVSAEDHYLRIHTSAGEELILMRLTDAIRELDGVEGLQTHRSWWVAKDGLADALRANGKLVLKLKSGAEAPVSRTYQKSVRDAGWA
mgnify:CR=1 FL=1